MKGERTEGTRIVRMSAEEIKRRLAAGEDRTDYERLERQTDGAIEEAVRENPDAVLLEGDALEEWFRAAQLTQPGGEKEKISIRLDESVLAFFRAGGRGYQSRINDVLRTYVLAQRIGGGGPSHGGNAAGGGQEA